MQSFFTNQASHVDKRGGFRITQEIIKISEP